MIPQASGDHVIAPMPVCPKQALLWIKVHAENMCYVVQLLVCQRFIPVLQYGGLGGYSPVQTNTVISLTKNLMA